MKQPLFSQFSVLSSSSTLGQSVIEVTVAATAIIFVLVAVVSGLILATKNSSFANQQGLATKRAQEAIESFRRYQVELGWESFYDELSSDGNTFRYCLPTLPETASEFASMASGNCQIDDYIPSTLFVREVRVIVRSASEISLEATVQWYEASDQKTAKVTQIFRQWQ